MCFLCNCETSSGPWTRSLWKTEMFPCGIESIATDTGKMPAAPQPIPSSGVTLSQNQPWEKGKRELGLNHEHCPEVWEDEAIFPLFLREIVYGQHIDVIGCLDVSEKMSWWPPEPSSGWLWTWSPSIYLLVASGREPAGEAEPSESWLLSKQSSIEPSQAHISRAPAKAVHDSLLRPVPHLEEDITDRLQKEVTSGGCCVRVSCV